MSEVTEDKKADAEAGEKLDKVLAAMDSIAKRMDALEAKKADEEEPKADEDEARDDADEYEDDEEGTLEEEVKGDADEYEDEDEEFEEDPKRVAADKKRKDAEERKMEETAKADSEIARRIASIERRLPKQMSDADYSAMAEAQAKADSVYQAFGDAAPRPLLGEDLPAYRRRLASGMKAHSAKLKSVNLGAIKDETAFSFMEDQIYADAMSAALKPVDLPAGQLREIKSRDTTGRQISTFVGEPRTWMASHQGVRRRLSHIERNPR